MGQIATRLSVVEGRPPPATTAAPATSSVPAYGIPGYGGLPPPATTAAPATSSVSAYGMPGYGGLPTAPAASTIVHAVASRPLSITEIAFPHSPSPIPTVGASPTNSQGGADDDGEGACVPRFHKLSFPTYDGKEDPLGWLNRCDHFFRAQRTRDADRVWLASFHMTSVAQHWYYMLERDIGEISWPQFKALCQQRFGPAIGTNHLVDLACLPFRGSVEDYQEAFQARMAHAGYLSQSQQVQLFTGGLPAAIRIEVELHGPTDLQKAMALARAFERRSATAWGSGGSRSVHDSQSATPVAKRLETTTTTLSASTGTPAAPQPPTPFKRLTPEAMAERRRQDLCY